MNTAAMVPRRAVGRRLTTVLFVDIVASTSIAAEIGDRGWQELLGQFRRIVRLCLHRGGGREIDTAGDGFFAVFDEPAKALRAALLISSEVQRIGLDVRVGVHTGECDVVNGRWAGLAVHIGARVMSAAGPAEVLVSRTVRDLVVGSDITVVERGTYELKGVPESWLLFAVTSCGGVAAPTPLEPHAATERIGVACNQQPRRPRWRTWPAAAAVGVIFAGATLAVLLLSRGGESPVAAQAPAPVSVLAIDPATHRPVSILRDQFVSLHQPQPLVALDGALWQLTSTQLVRRDVHTGKAISTVALPRDWRQASFGFDALWVASSPPTTGASQGSHRIVKIDLVSGVQQRVIKVPAGFLGLGVGAGAVWDVGSGGALRRIDPLTNRVTGPYRTGVNTSDDVVAIGNDVWICDCADFELVQFDALRHKVVRRLKIPAFDSIGGIADSSGGQRLWLIDPVAGTYTPVDPANGRRAQPRALGAGPSDEVVAADGDIWVAAGSSVYDIDPVTGDQRTIRMPAGVEARSITLDPITGKIWVGNCDCPAQRSYGYTPR